MNNLEQFALRWLQQQLREIFAIDVAAEAAFSASLPLSALPGKPDMRWLYAALRKRGVKLPPLFLSHQQHWVTAFLALIVLAGGIAICLAQPIHWAHFAVSIVAALFAWLLLVLLAKEFVARISSADTIGELASQIFAEQPMYFSRLSGLPLSRAQVQEIVTRVLIDACGVDRSEVTRETRLVDLME